MCSWTLIAQLGISQAARYAMPMPKRLASMSRIGMAD
jgi:hypothetical protein